MSLLDVIDEITRRYMSERKLDMGTQVNRICPLCSKWTRHYLGWEEVACIKCYQSWPIDQRLVTMQKVLAAQNLLHEWPTMCRWVWSDFANHGE